MRFFASTLAFAIATSLLGPAAATETLPSIVLYESARQNHEAIVAARAPKIAWVGQVSKLIDEMVRASPHQAKGTVRVGFTIAHDGHLVSERVDTSSGSEALDASVLALVAKAAPFPPMPDAFGVEALSFVVPVSFR